jgi:hypothetical protein
MMLSMRTTDPAYYHIPIGPILGGVRVPALPAVRGKLAPGGTIRIPTIDPISGRLSVDELPRGRDDHPYGFQRGPWACR